MAPSRREVLGLVLATLALAVVSTVFLSGRELWLDEAFSARVAGFGVADVLRFATHPRGELNMVGYYLLVGPISDPSVPDAVLRTPSFLAVLATVPVVWWLADRISGDPFVRVAATTLFLFQPLVWDHAFEARSYALLLFGVTGTTALLVAAVDGSRRAAVAYALLAPLLVSLQFVAVVVIATHAVVLLALTPGGVAARLRRTVLVAGPAVVVSCAALAVYASQSTLRDRGPMGVTTVLRLVYNLTGRAGPLTILVVVAIGVGAVVLVRRRSVSPSGLVVVATALVPPLIMAVLSLSRPMLAARYVLHLVALLGVVAAVGLAQLVVGRRARTATMAVVVALGLGGLAFIYHEPDREQAGTAARLVLDQAEEGDIIAFEAPFAQLAYQHHVDRAGVAGPRPVGRLPDEELPNTSRAGPPLDAAVQGLPEGAEAWLVIARVDDAEAEPQRRVLRQAGLVLRERTDLVVVSVERWGPADRPATP